MPDAGTTPVPAARNGNGRRNAIGVGGVVGIVTVALAIFAFLGVPSVGDIQTKSSAKADTEKVAADVRAVAEKLDTHVYIEGGRVGTLETSAAVHAKELEQHDKMIERALNQLEVLNANQVTFMRSASIPERDIRKPRDR